MTPDCDLLDASSPLPLHDQLILILVDRIASGRFTPGMRIGTPDEIAACFDVSDKIVHIALNRLATTYLITRDDDGTARVSDELIDITENTPTYSELYDHARATYGTTPELLYLPLKGAQRIQLAQGKTVYLFCKPPISFGTDTPVRGKPTVIMMVPR